MSNTGRLSPDLQAAAVRRLQQAVERRLPVTFAYWSPARDHLGNRLTWPDGSPRLEKITRTVEPDSVWQAKAGHWVMQGIDRAPRFGTTEGPEGRTFRIDRFATTWNGRTTLKIHTKGHFVCQHTDPDA